MVENSLKAAEAMVENSWQVAEATVESSLKAAEVKAENIQPIAGETVRRGKAAVAGMVENNLAVAVVENSVNKANGVVEVMLENSWKLGGKVESNSQHSVAEKVVNTWE